MARRRRKKIFGLFGAKRKRRAGGAAARMKRAPQHCKTGLSRCMTGGGRGKAGPCMRAFHRCLKGA
jgi:hypothetical protein